jgi:hypothetical protein
MDYDLYHLRDGSTPVRLSDFGLYELQSINVVGDKIVFSAEDGPQENSVIPSQKITAQARSDVYSVELDRQAQSVRKSPGTLPPLFLIGGYSIQASISQDSKYAAVLNTEAGKFRYRFDVVLVQMDGTIERRFNLEGLDFSSGVFVGKTLLFNELFEDRYELKLFDYTKNSLQTVMSIEHAPEKLQQLERIQLTIEGEKQAELSGQARLGFSDSPTSAPR